MDPRYSGRLSPPRRYAAPGRNSTGRLDTDYESYYQPRVVRDSPRTSAERLGPRIEQRLPPVSRSSRDDYYVAPRYVESGSRAPLTIVTPAGSSSRYRTGVSSATDISSSPYSRTRPREYEPYYTKPASSSHSRHLSVGGNDTPIRYAPEVDRDRERDRPAYKSSGHRQSEYLSPALPSRERRDRRDEYEYTKSRDPDYYEPAARPRTRRVSDLGTRDRPISFSGVEDLRREKGPPITTRGLAKLEDEGVVRREYRYPRDEPLSRGSGSLRDNRDERDRLRPSRGGLVAIHQEDGYSSNVEGRSADKSHRSRHRDATDRDRYDDERRVDEPIKKHQRNGSEDHRSKHHRTDSEDRRNRSSKYRDESQERRAPRDNDMERNDDRRERRRHDTDYKKDKHDDRHLAEGVAIGAAGIGAAGVIAEGLKHRQEKDSSDLDSETKKDRSRRNRRKDDDEIERGNYDETAEEDRPRRRREKHEVDGTRDSRDVEEDEDRRRRRREKRDADGTKEPRDAEEEEDRRERRRRRRRERTERELREKEEADGSSSLRDDEPRDHHSRSIVTAVPESLDPQDRKREQLPGDGPERTLRRHGRRRREKTSSSDTDSSDDSGLNDDHNASRVRVVSPARDDDKKPRSILRPPTQQFPEDPAPIREGVAPMKDAMKKGVPPDARWTKIDRRIVNPEALELAGLRFEERPDSVIVLQVLEKDTIENLAVITQELRARRSGQRNGSEEPRMIEGRKDRDQSSEEEKPKQIASHAYNDPVAATRDTQSDRSAVVVHDDQERPAIQKEQSYQRFAPPGVQVQSKIPTYPAIPGRSSASTAQPQTPSTAPLSPDPSYPSQGGGYKSNSS